MISGIIDILVITETKLNESFPEAQFFLEGYTMPYRLDRSEHGGGIMIFAREDIPHAPLIHLLPLMVLRVLSLKLT